MNPAFYAAIREISPEIFAPSNFHDKILKISIIDNLNLNDMLFIKSYLEKFGTIVTFRTSIDKYNKKVWFIEFQRVDSLESFITHGVSDLLRKYPFLQIGYF